jgi:hypothetical protein
MEWTDLELTSNGESYLESIEGTTAGISTRFTDVTPLLEKLPENRNAGS